MIRCAAIALVVLLVSPALADDEAVYTEWARKIEKSLDEHDPSVLDEATDGTALVERALRGLTLEASAKAGLLEKGKDVKLGTSLIRGIGDKGHVKLLRIRKRGDERTALFRFVIPGDQWGYHELVLSLTNGRVRAVDDYLFSAGGLVSESMRRNVRLTLGATREEKEGSGVEADLAKHMKEYLEVAQRVKTGDFAGALATFDALPRSLQEDKLLLLVGLRAADKTNQERYKELLDVFERLYGKEPGMQLVAINYHIRKREFARVHELLDSLDASLGGDAYIEYEHSAIYEAQEKTKEARDSARKAVERDPSFVDALWRVIDLALAAKDWKETADYLERIEKQGVELVDLTTVPAYAEFLKSPEYTAWAKKRAK
jgi:hypothetical protein